MVSKQILTAQRGVSLEEVLAAQIPAQRAEAAPARRSTAVRGAAGRRRDPSRGCRSAQGCSQETSTARENRRPWAASPGRSCRQAR